MKRTIFFKKDSNGYSRMHIWEIGKDPIDGTIVIGDYPWYDGSKFKVETDIFSDKAGYEKGVYFSLDELDKSKCTPAITGNTIDEVLSQLLTHFELKKYFAS